MDSFGQQFEDSKEVLDKNMVSILTGGVTEFKKSESSQLDSEGIVEEEEESQSNSN